MNYEELYFRYYYQLLEFVQNYTIISLEIANIVKDHLGSRYIRLIKEVADFAILSNSNVVNKCRSKVAQQKDHWMLA